MKFIASLLALTLAAGCAGVSPDSLRPATSGKSITLSAPVKYEEYYSMAGNRFHYAIEAGQYKAKFEDGSGGTYFEGSGECFSIRTEMDSLKKSGEPQPQAQRYRCGIFMPAGGAEPKLYFYRDPAVSAAIFGNSKLQVVDAKGAPATSVSAGVGGSIGVGIAQGIDAAELKNLHFFKDQPKPGQIGVAMGR